jgi:exopolysaccharide biosynthesis protein
MAISTPKTNTAKMAVVIARPFTRFLNDNRKYANILEKYASGLARATQNSCALGGQLKMLLAKFGPHLVIAKVFKMRGHSSRLSIDSYIGPLYLPIMKTIICIVTSFVIYSTVQAQTDSIVFAGAGWEKQKIKRGVWWKHCEFKGNLFLSSQYINILEVKNSGRRKFDLGFEETILKTTSDFGKDWKAIAALNGSFFDIKNGGSVDYLRADGKMIDENRLRENGNRADHQKAAIILKKGRLQIKKWDDTSDWEKQLEGEDVLLSGPLLIQQSTTEKLDSTSFSKTRHPRTAIAVTKNRILLITADGRDEHAAGMSLFELTKVLKWLGAVDGINLDGGGSTTLWIYNQPENGVVNFPSDNKVWDHAGERKVANVLLLKN